MNDQTKESKTAMETEQARATVDLTNIREHDHKHSIIGGKCLQFECGEANASVDLYTGRLLLTLPLFRNGDILPVSLIYNSHFFNAVQSGNKIGFGMGLNLQGSLDSLNNSYMDGSGIVHEFPYGIRVEETGTTEFEKNPVARKVYKYIANNYHVYAGDGSYFTDSNCTGISFPNGSLIDFYNGLFGKYYSNYNSFLTGRKLEYSYTSDTNLVLHLQTVKLDDVNFLSFAYNGELVKSITKGTETVNFTYLNGYLQTVQRVDGGVSTILLTCAYTNGNLTQAESLGNVLCFTHSGGKVTSVEERSRYDKVGATAVTNDLIGNKWNINHINGSWTRVTDKNELITDYFFGEGGKLIAESVATDATINPYKVSRGNVNFSQVQCFPENILVDGDSTEVMRERVHSCQATLKSTDVAYTYADAVNFDMRQNTTETKIFGSHNVSGSDLYVFTCWVKVASCMDNYVKFTDGEARNVGSDTFFGVRAQWFSSEAGDTKSLYVPLNAEIGGWQFVAVPFRSLSDRSARVDWFMDFANNSGKVDIKFPAVYKTHGNWQVRFENDYAISYMNGKHEILFFNQKVNSLKNILRENFTNTLIGTATNSYKNILPLTQTDYNGVKTEYTYDSKNRCTGKTMSKSGLSTSSNVTYDGFSGRIASETTAGGKVSYTYNKYGDCLTVKLPKGDGTTFAYNSRSLPETVTATKFASNTQSISYQNGFPIKYVCGTKTYEMTYDGFGRILEVKENGSVKKSVVYKDFGISLDGVSGATNSVTVTFANGFKTASYTDKYGQLIRVNENGSSVSELSYDASGNLTKSIDNIVNSEYTYTYQDGMPHTVKETRNGVVLLTTAYSTNADGEIDRVNFDYGLKKDEYTQTLDEYGRLKEETTPLGTMEYTYDALGRIEKRSGYGDFTKYLYLSTSTVGATNLPSRISFSDMSRYDITYDNNGNVTNIVSGDGNDNITYAYDNVGRLISETRKNKYHNTFAYDINGNLTEKNEYPYENGAIASAKRTRRIYTYTNGQMSAYDGKICSYDANGNPTNYLGTACEWTRGRLLKKFGNTSFEYNAEGLRTKKGNKEYIWSGDRILGEKENGKVTMRYFYDASGIAGYEYSGTKFVFRKNLQGDIIGIIDNTGTLLGTYEYDAWGNCTATKVIISGTSMVLSMNPFRYRGYYFDSETGLYYLQSRYYDPKTGRFISPDAYSYLEPDTVNGLNLYSYCNNNPVMYADPSGHIAFLVILLTGIFVGAAAGGAVNGINAYMSGARGGELAGAIFGGAIMGGAMGAVLAIGGAAGLTAAGATITGFSMSTSTAFALSGLIGIGAGMASYSAKALFAGNWNAERFAEAGLMGLLNGIATYWSAFVGGKHGVFNSYLVKQGGQMIASATSKFLMSSSSVFGMISRITNKFGADFTKLTLGSGIAAMLRWIINHLFV